MIPVLGSLQRLNLLAGPEKLAEEKRALRGLKSHSPEGAASPGWRFGGGFRTLTSRRQLMSVC